MELPPTPVKTLDNCIEVSRRAGLRYVYVGNVFGHTDESTYCYNCREPLILRNGMKIEKINLVKDRCPNCGLRINIQVD
jgi:pyruvate formate lyase activating enzyme